MTIPIPIPTRLRSASTSAPKSSSPNKFPGGYGTWTRSSSRDAAFGTTPTPTPPTSSSPSPPLPSSHHQHHSKPPRSRSQQHQARESIRRECDRIAKLVTQREDHFENLVSRLGRFVGAEQARLVKDVEKTLKRMLVDEKIVRREIEGLEAMRLSQETRLEREIARVTRSLGNLTLEQIRWEFEGLSAIRIVLRDKINWEADRVQLSRRTFVSELSQKISSLRLSWDASKDRMSWEKRREKDADSQEAKLIDEQVNTLRSAGAWIGQDKAVEEQLNELARLLISVWSALLKRWGKCLSAWNEGDKWVEGELQWVNQLQHDSESGTKKELETVMNAIRDGERRVAKDFEELERLRLARPSTPPRPRHHHRQHTYHGHRRRYRSNSPERPEFHRSDTQPEFCYGYEHAEPSSSYPRAAGGSSSWHHEDSDAHEWQHWKRERNAGHTPWATDAEDAFDQEPEADQDHDFNPHFHHDRDSDHGFESRPRRDKSRERSREKKEAHHRKVIAAWESYQSRWTAIQASPPPSPISPHDDGAGAPSTQWLSFRDVPWPIVRTPSSPSSLTVDRISSFLLSNAHSPEKSRKERLRNAILFWHPDKWEGKWLNRVDPDERALVKEGVGMIATALNELMREESNRRATV